MNALLRTALSLSVVGVIAAPSGFAREKVTETLSATPIRTTNAAQADMVSTMAVSSMRYIADARGNIHDKDYTQAKLNLDQAQSLFQMISHNLPSMRLRDEISIAKKHLDYEETATVEPDLIPMYREIAFIQDEPSRSKLRGGLDRVKNFLHLGKKNDAKVELSRLEQAVVFTQVNLPLQETEDLVSAAKDKLAAKDYAGADATLARAEGGLRVNVAALIGPEDKSASKKKAE
jgi:hypothetical protein